MLGNAKIICHLGLGDLILHSALVPYLLESGYEKVYFPTRARDERSVRSFFFLTPNVEVYIVPSEGTTPGFCAYGVDTEKCDIIATGFNGPVQMDGSMSFSEAFYKQIDVPYDVRFSHCPIQKVCEYYYNTEIDTYFDVFYHDDITRDIRIKDSYKGFGELLEIEDIEIGTKDCQSSILAHYPYIKHSHLVRAIDGPFMHLIDSLDNIKADLEYHKYARIGRMWNNIDVPHKYRQWKVIE